MDQKPKIRKYPFLCLKLLVDHTNRLVPHIVYTAWEILRETYQRKHPTTGQLKILKEKLPELSVLPHLMSSSVFRANLVTDEFLEGIANIALDFQYFRLFFLLNECQKGGIRKPKSITCIIGKRNFIF